MYVGLLEGFGLPLGRQHCEVTPGVLVLLNGLEEGLEVSSSKALEHTDGRRMKQRSLLHLLLWFPFRFLCFSFAAANPKTPEIERTREKGQKMPRSGRELGGSWSSRGGGAFESLPVTDTTAARRRRSSTYEMVVALDDLQEQGWPVLHGFGEDLQEVALVVKVH